MNQDTQFPILLEQLTALETLALQHQIPVIKLKLLLSDDAELLASYRADAIIVSCFSRKIPDRLLSIPGKGCFNLHPSVLPAYRGPVPLFWQFKEGSNEFGVTLHKMTTDFDAGDIVAVSATKMPDGIEMKMATRLLAGLAAELLVDSLLKLEQGQITMKVQDEQKASYHSYPLLSDYQVSSRWAARRLYNFMAATRQDGVVYPCWVHDQSYHLLQAVGYSSNGYAPFSINEDIITFPCHTGWVQARFECVK